MSNLLSEQDAATINNLCPGNQNFRLGDKLRSALSAIFGLGAIIGERLTGTINGSNKVFTSVYPFISGKTVLSGPATRMVKDVDYTETTPCTITVIGPAPRVEDERPVMDYVRSDI